MEWLHTLSIITTVVGSTYYFHRDIKEDMQNQTARTDKLYEMFLEVQKEIKDLYVRTAIIETKIEEGKK